MQGLSYFAHFSSLSAFVPAVLGLVVVKYLGQRIGWIPWLAITSLCADGFALMMLSRGVNNWPVVNLFFIVQFTFLFLVLGYKSIGRWCDILFGLCILFSIINYLFVQTPEVLNSATTYVMAVFMVLVSGLYLYRLVQGMPVERVQDLPLFWVSCAVLIYFAGTTFLFLFTNYLIAHELKVSQAVWMLHHILNISKNVLLTVAIWKQYTRQML